MARELPSNRRAEPSGFLSWSEQKYQLKEVLRIAKPFRKSAIRVLYCIYAEITHRYYKGHVDGTPFFYSSVKYCAVTFQLSANTLIRVSASAEDIR